MLNVDQLCKKIVQVFSKLANFSKKIAKLSKFIGQNFQNSSKKCRNFVDELFYDLEVKLSKRVIQIIKDFNAI